LIRAHFAADAGLHAQAKKEALTIREDLLRGKIDPEENHPHRIVLELNLQDLNGHRSPTIFDPLHFDDDVKLIKAQWLDGGVLSTCHSLKTAPSRNIGDICETTGAFLIPVVLSRNKDDVRLAVFGVEKAS
jgi:hypothetical protein